MGKSPAEAIAESGVGGRLVLAMVTLALLGGWVGRRNSDPRTSTMTDDKIALRALLEKGSDTLFLREMIGLRPNA